MHTQPFHGNISFNAHHSPMGAYFTFTCGHPGTRGGLAVQLGKTASQDLYIGVKLGGRHKPAPIRALPFFDGAQTRMQDGETAFTLEKPGGETDALSAYHPRELRRHYGWATDTWKAGPQGSEDFEFSIFTPFSGIPDPATAEPHALRAALRPAITAEMVIDNRRGTETKTAFFAVNFNEGGARILDEGLPKGRAGFAWRAQYGVAAEAIELSDDNRCSRDADGCSTIVPFTIMRWSVQQGLEDKSNPVHLLGTVPGVGIEVPAGKRVVLRIALGCYLAGIVTTRLEGQYLYTRHYSGLTDVLNAALDDSRKTRRDAAALDERLEKSNLNRDQQFLIAHATRSYYGNTQLLDIAPNAPAPEPYWIVNEGEYCMMNTLDLSVDQMFWELDHNPWVVKNLLDNFVKRYSYIDHVTTDQVTLPGKARQNAAHDQSAPPLAPGGISFTHDQGVHNQFSPFGTSSYELKDLTGCFSYMTQEQLCNWILMATSYVARTGESTWARHNRGIIEACYQSMRNRALSAETGANCQGDAIMKYDSSACGRGQEITTYDSLDHSLCQARNNSYIAVKSWAAFRGLELLCAESSDPLGEPASESVGPMSVADRIEESLLKSVGAELIFPAIVGETSEFSQSRVLSIIESLIYPSFWAASPGFASAWAAQYLNINGNSKDFLGAVFLHLASILSDPQRRNHFPDAGIKLSSTSDNSWLSKIALVQHVARTLFNLDENGRERPPISNLKSEISNSAASPHGWEKSDAAHVRWLTEGESAFHAASDQFINGVAKGSRYYPRLITTALWLSK